jgi:hypothetical protein
MHSTMAPRGALPVARRLLRPGHASNTAAALRVERSSLRWGFTGNASAERAPLYRKTLAPSLFATTACLRDTNMIFGAAAAPLVERSLLRWACTGNASAEQAPLYRKTLAPSLFATPAWLCETNMIFGAAAAPLVERSLLRCGFTGNASAEQAPLYRKTLAPSLFATPAWLCDTNMIFGAAAAPVVERSLLRCGFTGNASAEQAPLYRGSFASAARAPRYGASPAPSISSATPT